MSKNKGITAEDLLWIFGIFIAGCYPFLPDPYYHVEKVGVWEWIAREINELLHGERQ